MSLSRSRIAVLAASAILLVAGCGADDDDADAADQGDSADHSGHVMDEPDATRADEIADADLRSGTFEVLPTAPPGIEEVGGEVWVAENGDGTTVTADMTGLEPETEYMLHLHAQPCGQESGGPHFMFDTSGPEEPPNEVHLSFTTDGDGAGSATVTNDQRVGEGASSIVAHPMDAMDNRVACADF